MFDIGFWELMMIGLVGLLVIGPERLPKLARTAGFWLGRAQRFVTNVKQDIDQEMRAEELKRILDKQNQVPAMDEIIEEAGDVFREAKGLDDARRGETRSAAHNAVTTAEAQPAATSDTPAQSADKKA